MYSSTSARRISCLRWLIGITGTYVLATYNDVAMILCLSMMIASSLTTRLQVQNSTQPGGLSSGFALLRGAIERSQRGSGKEKGGTGGSSPPVPPCECESGVLAAGVAD